MSTAKTNWFNTLNEALEAEGLTDLWPLGLNIGYNQEVNFVKSGTYVSVYRDEHGRYERPIHYDSMQQDWYN